MTQIIKIKRSTSSAQPSSALAGGELAYSFNSDKLFIGDGSGNDIIGGKLYVDMLSHTGGQLTAASAIITDANKKIDDLLVDNLQINGNTISSTSGNLTLSSATGSISVAGAATEVLILDNSSTAFTITEGSTNYLTFDTSNSAEKIIFNKQIAVGTEYTLPTTDGTSGQALVTNGSGTVSFQSVAATLTVDGESTSADVALLTDDLRIVGGTGVSTSVSKSGTDVTLAVSIDNGGISTAKLAADAVTGAKIADDSINSEHLVNGSIDDAHIAAGTIANNKLVNNTITIGSDAVSLGGTIASINGLTELDVDNLTLNGNELSSTNTNGDISLNPNGSGTVDVNNSRISNVTDPTQAQDAATKAYVDAVKQALDIKDSVRVATTANITISSDLNVGDTIDGVSLADGDRVLVKNQSDASTNGIYVAGSSPARSTDANTSSEVTAGLFTFVEEGTTNADTGFVLTTNDAITLGNTDLAFTAFSGAGQIVAGDGLNKSGTTITVDDDNITLQADGTNLRIKGITATAVGDLLIGAASNAGYTRLTKPSANGAFLTMGTSGSASWTTTIDGGSF